MGQKYENDALKRNALVLQYEYEDIALVLQSKTALRAEKIIKHKDATYFNNVQ